VRQRFRRQASLTAFRPVPPLEDVVNDAVYLRKKTGAEVPRPQSFVGSVVRASLPRELSGHTSRFLRLSLLWWLGACLTTKTSVSADHAAIVDNLIVGMSETLSTINQLAVEAESDPRTVELTLTRNGVRPVARLHSEKRPQPLWNRAEAIRVISAALNEGSRRNS
jgi:hypothetical protein